MKRLLLLITIIANSILLNAQEFCLTGGNYVNRLPFSSTDISTSDEYHLNVFFHIGVYDLDNRRSGVQKAARNDSDENMSPDELCSLCMKILNEDFNPHGIFFHNKGSGHFYENGKRFDTDNGRKEAVAGILHHDAINIYILDSWALYSPDTFVWANCIPGNALIVKGTYRGVHLATTHAISHAMGHCLGLYHTYHGSTAEPGINACVELSSGDNCETCGDYICDTPADSHNQNSNLIMADVPIERMSRFTSGQGERMKKCISRENVLQEALITPEIPDFLWIHHATYYRYVAEPIQARDSIIVAYGYVQNGVVDNGPVVVSYGGDVTFEAAETIILNSGFRVEKGAHFQAKINPSLSLSQTRSVTRRAPNHVAGDVDIVEKETSDFSVSPNPAHNEITIHCSTPIEQVAIYNLNGQIVLQSSQTQIDLSALSQGVYIVRVLTTDGQVLQAKVLHE